MLVTVVLIVYRFIFVYKLVTLFQGDPKAPFPKATTPRCRKCNLTEGFKKEWGGVKKLV